MKCAVKLFIYCQTSTVQREWIINFISHSRGRVITYPCLAIGNPIFCDVYLETDSGRIIYIVAGPGHVDTLRPLKCFNEVGIGLCKGILQFSYWLLFQFRHPKCFMWQVLWQTQNRRNCKICWKCTILYDWCCNFVYWGL